MSCFGNISAAVGGASVDTCLHKVMLGLDDSIGSGLHRVIEGAFLFECFNDRFAIWDGGSLRRRAQREDTKSGEVGAHM